MSLLTWLMEDRCCPIFADDEKTVSFFFFGCFVLIFTARVGSRSSSTLSSFFFCDGKAVLLMVPTRVTRDGFILRLVRGEPMWCGEP